MTSDEYSQAVMKARAAAALGIALDGSLDASLNALYEAYHAVDAQELFLRSVTA